MRTLQKCTVTCYLDGRQNLRHLSKMHAGLLQLHRSRQIRLRFQSARPIVPRGGKAPWQLWWHVSWDGGREERRVVIEDADDCAYWNEDALRECDVYYKRNYRDDHVAKIAEPQRSKVLPFGLNFCCWVDRQRWTILRRSIPNLIMRTARSPRAEARWMKRRYRAMRSFIRVRHISEYEQSPDHAVEPIVFTQLRVWEVHGNRDADAEVNLPRIELIRALKKGLGKRFVGGIAPNEFARRRWPDLLSPVSRTPKDFIDASKRALIGVTSEPCVRTSSLKLAEYMAASRCMVSMPIPTTLPRPLSANENYLPYETVDECVERCVELLENPSLAAGVRRANWEYYQDQVAPSAHVRNLLQRCMDHPVAG